MKPRKSEFTRSFLSESQHSLAAYHMPRLIRCLKMLPEREIWWRPNAASNSAGNLVLHVSGNMEHKIACTIRSGVRSPPNLPFRQHLEAPDEPGHVISREGVL